MFSGFFAPLEEERFEEVNIRGRQGLLPHRHRFQVPFQASRPSCVAFSWFVSGLGDLDDLLVVDALRLFFWRARAEARASMAS